MKRQHSSDLKKSHNSEFNFLQKRRRNPSIINHFIGPQTHRGVVFSATKTISSCSRPACDKYHNLLKTTMNVIRRNTV